MKISLYIPVLFCSLAGTYAQDAALSLPEPPQNLTKDVLLSVAKDRGFQLIEIEPSSDGKAVKSQELILTGNVDTLQSSLEQAKTEWETATLNLSRAQAQLEQAKKNVETNLAAAETKLKRSQEDLEDFEKTFMNGAIQDADQSVKVAEERLLYATEDLRQLNRMYKEDQITEESEELILKRSKNDKDNSSYGLQVAKIKAEWSKNRSIPRQLEDKKVTVELNQVALNHAKENSQFDLKAKDIAVEGAKLAVKNAEKKVKLAQHRLAQAEITIPESGSLLKVHESNVQEGTNVTYILVNGQKQATFTQTKESKPCKVGDKGTFVYILNSNDSQTLPEAEVVAVEGDQVTLKFN